MIHYTNTTLPDPPQPLRILHHRKLQILRLVRHPCQSRILARHFISHRRCQPFQAPCHLERLVQVLVQLIFQLVVRGGRVKLVPRAGVFARPLLARHGFGRGRGGVWRRVGSCAESFAGVLDVHEGFGAIHAFHGVALVDLVFLRLPFGFLPFSTVSQSVSIALCIYTTHAYLVPDDGGTKDASAEGFQFCSLVFRTLVVGLGHVEVSLRVGDPFCRGVIPSVLNGQLDDSPDWSASLAIVPLADSSACLANATAFL